MLKPLPLALLALASLLASGCYCPMLSGRHGDPVFCPPCLPPGPAAPEESDCCPHTHGLGHRGCFLGKILGLGERRTGGSGGSGPVPSRQGPDYLSPLAKFHPIPTQPAFEPLPAYAPPLLVDRPPVPAHAAHAPQAGHPPR